MFLKSSYWGILCIELPKVEQPLSECQSELQSIPWASQGKES